MFYGYTDKIIPMKYLGGPLMSVGQPDQGAVLARYPGGDANVLSGLMRGADEIANRPFAIDVPGGYSGQGARRPLLEQPDLSLAEPRRVQHGVQRHAELERPRRPAQRARPAPRRQREAAVRR